MHPNLFESLPIRSYGLFLLLGFVAAYVLARWRARREGVEVVHVENLVLIIVLAGVIGARLFFVIFYARPESFWGVFKVWEGGLVFYGGVALAAIGAVVYIRLKRLSLAQLADIIGPSVALGLVFGRIGCFLNGCCWGDVCMAPGELAAKLQARQVAVAAELRTETGSLGPWESGLLKGRDLLRYQVQSVPELSGPGFPLAVRFPYGSFAHDQHWRLGLLERAERSLPVHPVQLYESLLSLGLCVVLNVGFARRRLRGEVFFAFGVGYAAMRFWMEVFRADNKLAYWGMTLSQVIGLVIAATCVIWFICRRVGARGSVRRGGA